MQPLKTVRWTSGLAKAPASAPAASAAVSLEQPPHPVEADLEPFNSRTTGFHVPVHSDRGLPGNRSALCAPGGRCLPAPHSLLQVVHDDGL